MKSVVLLVLVLLPLHACDSDRSETDECIDLRERANQAALDGHLSEAHVLLAQARASCSPASDYYFDRVERSLDRQERHEAREKKSKVEPYESPLLGFVEWVGGIREAKNKALGEHTCAKRGSKNFGFCQGKVKAGTSAYELEYSLADSDAYRFSYAHSGVLACIDLGEHRDVTRWTEGPQKRESCVLSSRSLRGLRALIVQGSGSSVVALYSAKYLEAMPELRDQLKP